MGEARDTLGECVMLSLKGRTALVTGAGRNIGRAIVLKLAEEGANVVVNARDSKESHREARNVAKEARAFGVRAIAVAADVSDPVQVGAMVKAATKELGTIHILVNNAAIRPSSPLLETTDEEWDRVLKVVLYGPFYCARAVVPGMIEAKWGRIISISGISGIQGAANKIHVVTAKAGLTGFSKGLAKELAQYNITANTVVPSRIDTKRRHMEWYPHVQKANDFAQGIPLGRMGRPEEIAALCAFLASEEAQYINGAMILATGGHYM